MTVKTDHTPDWFTIQNALEMAVRSIEHQMATMISLTPESDANYRALLSGQLDRYRAELDNVRDRWRLRNREI